MSTQLEYKVVAGLEIHVQLCTQSKLFCGCVVGFGEKPNSRVCPVCLGMPGALPVMHKEAFEYAVVTAVALNCETAELTKWDRKSYYYPDLPKNYQISQYEAPLGSNGFIEIPMETGRRKKISITRVHLEEDAGKNLHTGEDFSQVDLNRAGTPLVEIVTGPDMNSSAEVRETAVQLQRIVRYLGVSNADMQKGQMRFEPNINLIITKDGCEYQTAIVEIKNLNSFRALERSVDYEIQRQFEEFAGSGKIKEAGNKTTRGWDVERQATFVQREKEETEDYRYFPEPDLLPVELNREWLEDIRERLCELPIQKQRRYVQEYGLCDLEAGVLTAERSTAEFFEQAVSFGGDAKRVCNLLTQVGLKMANEAGCIFAELDMKARGVAALAKMIEGGEINAGAASVIMPEMVKSGKEPQIIAEELDLILKSDAEELESIVEQILAENPKAVEDVRKGDKKSKKAEGFLLGQVMQQTKGRANPKVISQILTRKLS
ncbi:MAG: Asp-tRNA(Asn)/Glu-tRNA(Gln) amidotransferase subunit GatB [Planctomycetota bacterium]|jgi:aspartyl-tRNA(Asn)/glutamyl-tRNA(Gln) amidotransferase subunit B